MGQHFLINPTFLDLFLKHAEIDQRDSVFEVGTGLGSLTSALASVARRVLSLEKDPRLYEIARVVLQGLKPIRVINADAIEVDWRRLLKSKEKRRWLFAGNLPYSVSKRLLEILLDHSDLFRRAVFSVQWEVGQRLVAPPGSEYYGLLSLLVRLKGDVRIVGKIPPSAFLPRPEVFSALVVLDFYSQPLLESKKERSVVQIAKAALSQRRKTIANALKASLRLPATSIPTMLAEAGISGERRGESLSLDELLRLAEMWIAMERRETKPTAG